MRVIILGAGESGVGAAALAQKKHNEVFVSDMGQIQPKYKQMLDDRGIRWEEGHHTEAEILSADLVIKSPGIPETAPMVAKLKAKGTPIISEIEYAARYTKSRMICITGSNGKTTTTTLVHYIMQKAGVDAGLAGNIGRSLALQVAESPHDTYVIELSSFQLDNMYDFRANIAVLLNITPDHLDRYDFRMQNYVDAKMRILQNQTKNDTFVYWDDDEHTPMELVARKEPSHKCGFTDAPCNGSAGYVDGDRFVVNSPVHFEMPLDELALPGIHNVRNCLAAAIATLAAGVDPEVLRECLKTFPGVPHRLEKAGTYNGVYYVNDSKATNVDACYWAMKSMKTPVVLILGGKDKGNDYSQILPLVQEKCRALVFMGVDNAPLHKAFDNAGIPIADTASLDDCVKACIRLAQPGDTVLLSPCCASFDLFKNMADRGNQFKERVAALA